MLSKCWKSRAAILTTLAVLGAVTLPVLTNIKALAQTLSAQSTQCTDVEIEKYIQQLNTGESSAVDALVGCNSKAVPALIKALQHKDKNIRIFTIIVLGQIGENAAPALPFLNALLRYTSTDRNVRTVAAYALGKISWVLKIIL